MKPSLETVLTELQSRKSKPFILDKYLFKNQLEFVQDPSRFKLALTTRRAGKTVSCAAALMATALEEPMLVCLYITLSRTNAKKIVWRELKKIDRQFGLGFVFNESELSAIAANGSIIYCSGASDRTEIEKFRGLAVKIAFIDECQSFPDYIRDLIDDVIAPALMDHSGTLCLIGTPGPIPTGFFYEASQGGYWSKHVWSFWDNPHIKNAKAVFDEELKRKGVDASNPSIQREWYGKWVLDTDSLVYHYSEKDNHYEALPKGHLNYIMGVDLGFNDADAIAILAWSDVSPCTYLVEEQITRKQGITELVSQIESLRSKYDVSKIVVDQGGLGKKIAEELSKRYKIGVQAAEKVRKAEFIELMNDCMRTGTLKAKKDSRFADDCMKVEWDVDKSTPDKKIISKRFHSDICEAVLYAWRESYSYTHQPPKTAPKYLSKEWAKEEENRMFDAELEKLMQEKQDGLSIWNTED